ncbi:MAG: hypothetical protein JSV32_00470 [Dehalococcoidia bacterium]|nr:MAG: hypothetical protein JSV32_00470 [Dehalococcoidia bacterium]
MKKIEYLLGSLLALVVADGIISQFLIEEGLGREGNPLLKTIATDSDFLIIKMCGAVISVIILWNMARRKPKLVLISSSIFVLIYTAILFWNISLYIVSIV